MIRQMGGLTLNFRMSSPVPSIMGDKLLFSKFTDYRQDFTTNSKAITDTVDRMHVIDSSFMYGLHKSLKRACNGSTLQ